MFLAAKDTHAASELLKTAENEVSPRFCRETGRIPCCQVEVDNLPSLNLQRKLQLEISPETLLLAWGE